MTENDMNMSWLTKVNPTSMWFNQKDIGFIVIARRNERAECVTVKARSLAVKARLSEVKINLDEAIQ